MNFNLLKAKIIEQGFTMKSFLNATGIKKNSMYRRLSGSTEFNRKEIEIISETLSLSASQIKEIFFNQ